MKWNLQEPSSESSAKAEGAEGLDQGCFWKHKCSASTWECPSGAQHSTDHRGVPASSTEAERRRVAEPPAPQCHLPLSPGCPGEALSMVEVITPDTLRGMEAGEKILLEVGGEALRDLSWG